MTLKEAIGKIFLVVSEDDREAFTDTLIPHNMLRIRQISFVGLPIECILLARILWVIWQGGARDSATPVIYMVLYLFLIFLMIVVLFSWHAYRRHPQRARAWARILPPLVTWLSLIWSAAIALLDMAGASPQSAALIAMHYALAVLLTFSPLTMLLIMGSTQVLFVIGILVFLPDFQAYGGLLVNTLLNAVIAWVIARIMYAAAYKQFSANRMIQRQNDELYRLNAELAELSTKDPLTKLMNRRRFDEIAEQEWRRACREDRPLVLAIADVDYFKQYNDVYGHLKGDECLRRVADAIGGQFRRASETVARYGGEEFVILFGSKGMENDRETLLRLKNAVEGLGIEHAGSQAAPVVTISLGACRFAPTRTYQFDAIAKIADMALYEAKREGRNSLVLKTDAEDGGERTNA